MSVNVHWWINSSTGVNRGDEQSVDVSAYLQSAVFDWLRVTKKKRRMLIYAAKGWLWPHNDRSNYGFLESNYVQYSFHKFLYYGLRPYDRPSYYNRLCLYTEEDFVGARITTISLSSQNEWNHSSFIDRSSRRKFWEMDIWNVGHSLDQASESIPLWEFSVW